MEPIKLSQGTAQRDDAGNLHIDQSGHHVILNALDTALIRDYLQLPLPEITGPQPATAPLPVVSSQKLEVSSELPENTVTPESVVPPLKKPRKKPFYHTPPPTPFKE